MSDEVTPTFPWPSYYGHFNFFEARMRGHGSVKAINANPNGVYDLTLTSGRLIRVFICECYSFGVAEYTEVTQKLGHLDAIIINSAWCGYTWDAKRTTRADKVGLYKIGDFMSALNKHNAWDHLNDAEKEKFAKEGWL
ncbi:hypothetical protein [Bradyrhizobium sp. S69]|uniref:hypothetical protein n=1 Tax=Bradyrhizobium sp. S69 TaxID=1641856 RepID=UPI00131E7F76|nr:hypothetical protein [Bradyrhizobium sp. S69]